MRPQNFSRFSMCSLPFPESGTQKALMSGMPEVAAAMPS